MRRDHHRLTDAGLTLALVGQGTRDETAEFVQKLKLPYLVLADDERVAYAAYGLIEAGAREFFRPETGRAYLRSVLSGAGGGKPVGNVRQLGGAFIVDRTGIVRLAHPSAYPGDHATTAALEGAVVAASRDSSMGEPLA